MLEIGAVDELLVSVAFRTINQDRAGKMTVVRRRVGSDVGRGRSAERARLRRYSSIRESRQ